MPQHIVINSGNSPVGTENVNIALTTDSGEIIKICRIRISLTNVAATSAVRVRFLRTSTRGSGTYTTLTPVKKDPLSPASVILAEGDNDVNALASGTVIDVIDDISFNGRSMLEWSAIDEDDYIIIANGDIFEVTTNPSDTGVTTRTTIEWIEQ